MKGLLILNKDYDQYTDGEMDLLLAKQALEIKQANAARAGLTRAVQGYEQAIGCVDRCLACIDNPAAIAGIGDELIAVGKAKKTPKTKAGKFLKKVAGGIKKGVKAVTKVITAPVRLIAKGAMEIYLPKAAPFFLYLFYDKPERLPDAMKRKRIKAEKFKKFVTGALGMKEKHFMAIIRNNLNKRFGKEPEVFLAERLRAAGINGIGRISYIGKAKKGGKAVKHANPKKTRAQKAARKTKPVAAPQPLANARAAVGPALPELSVKASEALAKQAPVIDAQGAGKKAGNLWSGDLISTAINALIWLVQKIASLGKKTDGIDRIEPADFPDPDNDIGEAFNYADLKQPYDNVPPARKEELKQVVTELIVREAPVPVAKEVIKEAFPELKTAQVDEMVEEVDEGLEPLDDEEVKTLAADVKASAGGSDPGRINTQNGGGGGFCGGLFA